MIMFQDCRFSSFWLCRTNTAKWSFCAARKCPILNNCRIPDNVENLVKVIVKQWVAEFAAQFCAGNWTQMRKIYVCNCNIYPNTFGKFYKINGLCLNIKSIVCRLWHASWYGQSASKPLYSLLRRWPFANTCKWPLFLCTSCSRFFLSATKCHGQGNHQSFINLMCAQLLSGKILRDSCAMTVPENDSVQSDSEAECVKYPAKCWNRGRNHASVSHWKNERCATIAESCSEYEHFRKSDKDSKL